MGERRLCFWFCDADCPFEVYLEYSEDDTVPRCSKCGGSMHLEWLVSEARAERLQGELNDLRRLTQTRQMNFNHTLEQVERLRGERQKWIDLLYALAAFLDQATQGES